MTKSQRQTPSNLWKNKLVCGHSYITRVNSRRTCTCSTRQRWETYFIITSSLAGELYSNADMCFVLLIVEDVCVLSQFTMTDYNFECQMWRHRCAFIFRWRPNEHSSGVKVKAIFLTSRRAPRRRLTWSRPFRRLPRTRWHKKQRSSCTMSSRIKSNSTTIRIGLSRAAVLVERLVTLTFLRNSVLSGNYFMARIRSYPRH